MISTIPLLIGAACFTVGTGIGAIVFRAGMFPRLGDRKKSGEAVVKGTTFSFSGNLSHTSLLEAIQFLEIGRREGILHIYCGKRKGFVTFADGAVIDAFYRNLTGREAVVEMFGISEGDFHFEPKTVIQPRVINDSAIDLAFEWDARKSVPIEG